MPNMAAKMLLQEMEGLRRELDRILEANPELLGSQQVYALSARLDNLITCYMRFMAKSPDKTLVITEHQAP